MSFETAPKNVPILVTDGKCIISVELGEWVGKDWFNAHGVTGDEWEYEFDPRDATHWMPLPELPC